MERETGIEPATSSLGSWRSTAELLPLTGFRRTIVSEANQSLALRAAGNNRRGFHLDCLRAQCLPQPAENTRAQVLLATSPQSPSPHSPSGLARSEERRVGKE